MKICVCLDTFFVGLDLSSRIDKIRKIGFNAIEFWHWDKNEIDISTLEKIQKKTKIKIICFSISSPTGDVGGNLLYQKDFSILMERASETFKVAQQLKTNLIVLHIGTLLPEKNKGKFRRNIEKRLRNVVELATEHKKTILLEPLNTKVDHPGYYLDSTKEAFSLVENINSPYLKVLLDLYHMQIMEGNLLATISQSHSKIGHFHIAGVPHRNEPFKGELNYNNILKEIIKMGYKGYFGLEYFPSLKSAESLKRVKKYLE